MPLPITLDGMCSSSGSDVNGCCLEVRVSDKTPRTLDLILPIAGRGFVLSNRLPLFPIVRQSHLHYHCCPSCRPDFDHCHLLPSRSHSQGSPPSPLHSLGAFCFLNSPLPLKSTWLPISDSSTKYLLCMFSVISVNWNICHRYGTVRLKEPSLCVTPLSAHLSISPAIQTGHRNPLKHEREFNSPIGSRSSSLANRKRQSTRR